MRSRDLFLLVYILGSFLEGSSAERNAWCTSKEGCGQVPDATSNFLYCVGLPPTDTGTGHLRRLKEMLEAIMDVYTFMKSSAAGVPLLSLEGALYLNQEADPLQNEALVQMWLEVKMRPLLKSVTRHFLSCLSTKNFSCSTYHMVVQDISLYYSDMDPVRQKWIYTFFMYPFLSGDEVKGCAEPDESSEEWLMKNFGAFRVLARIKDFSSLNLAFSGLDVLHLLSPAQKAELLMRPEVASLGNGTVALIFHSMSMGGMGPPTTATPSWGHNWTAMPTYYPPAAYEPYKPPPPTSLTEVVDGVMMAFKPLRSFVHHFVAFTKERDVSEIRSATLTQFLLNWTLAEVADIYRPPSTSVVPAFPDFDVANVEDWYQQVVMPVLRRFLPNQVVDENIRLAFHEMFFSHHNNGTAEIYDVCSITLEKNPCGLTDVVEDVANVLHCAAKTNLTVTEESIQRLMVQLAERLNSLMKELSTANFQQVAMEIQQIFDGAEPPSLVQQNLEDPQFIHQWFNIKLLPLLPNVSAALLSCLSTKNFSCPAYQTIVSGLSYHLEAMDADPMDSLNIYEHFIYPFLLHHNSSDPQCVSSANNSLDWLQENFGSFSHFASITDFYALNPTFSGLEVLHLLSAKQLAELLLLPLRTPPGKDVVIQEVFDFLTETPAGRRMLPEVLHFVVDLAGKNPPSCAVYEDIFTELYRAIPSLSPDHEPLIWSTIDDLIFIAPQECLPENLTCPAILVNGSANFCNKTDSSALESSLTTSMQPSCNFPLEDYACAQLDNFTAGQLAAVLKCDFPGNTSHSKVLWKILLTKLSSILDPALDILANMPMAMVGPSAVDILDVIGEMRVSLLTEEQLSNSSVVSLWFSGRLSSFLPSASGRFLHCLSSRNLSCQSYQQILQVFNHQFRNMTERQQQVVLKNFILHYLQQPQSGSSCVSTSNSSDEWLLENLGSFSMLLPLDEVLHLNPQFNPLDALQHLTLTQSAQVLLLDFPGLPDQDVVISRILDGLNQSDLPQFLSHLVMFLQPDTLTCSSYRTLFARLDEVIPTASMDVASSIVYNKMELSKYIPPGCIIYSGEENCNVTMTNETEICMGVSSTELQLHLDSGTLTERLCDFDVEQFACASVSNLTAEELAAVVRCRRSSNHTGSRPVWKLFLSKASHVLDEALELLSNTEVDTSDPALPLILDSIREIRLDTITAVGFNKPSVVQLWFDRRLRSLLPAVSQDFLSCLAAKGFNCSAYQHIVQSLSSAQPHMTLDTQMSVYTHFIQVFLARNDSAGPVCGSNINNTGQWLQTNLGAFSHLVSFQDLQTLYPPFSAMEALPHLTVQQLAEVSATPGQLSTPDQVTMVMNHVPSEQLATFFDEFSPAVTGHEDMIPSPVRSAMLQVVFDRAGLSDHSVSDSVVSVWIHDRLRPLLVELSPMHVAPFFMILAGRNCSVEQQGVVNLNQTIATLSNDTQAQIHDHIIQSLRGALPLRCYINGHSFYQFLLSSFLGFQFPNLTTFVSLMPHDRMPQLVNSMPPSDLGELLRRPDFVDNEALLCVIYSTYSQTAMFLGTEHVVPELRGPTLFCTWPSALMSSDRAEVDLWFNSLQNFTPHLTKTLISPEVTHNASCLAFQRVVLILGGHNYTAADFGRQDVFNSITDYLTSAMEPRCYNASHPDLNSTAWFAEYIGPFMSFLTLEGLQTFGSQQVIQVFTVNPLNIALINHNSLPLNLTDYYTQLVYQQDGNFNPLLLPPLCRCVAPGPAFSQLTPQESRMVLSNLTEVCPDLDTQISAALAANFGTDLMPEDIAALGSLITSLSTSQLMTINATFILGSLVNFTSVTAWTGGQARAIISVLLGSGMMQINSSSALILLGSLVMGVPSGVFTGINGSQLIVASQHSGFLEHMTSAPGVVQESFITQIISVNRSSQAVVQNVPDDFAAEIPRVLLLQLASDPATIKTLNQKKWKHEQVVLFFSLITTESATDGLGGVNNLSSSVLQGFTCTGVRTLGAPQIKRLIEACRRSGRNRVALVETQLTCMYNHLRGDPNVTSFDRYPPDVLLYYDYSLVPAASCRFYFEQLADADFSVFSETLSFKREVLFNDASGCLGITNTSLTKDNVQVLGNMCCTLNGTYVQNSDPSILENLKNCDSLTDDQPAGVEALLRSNTTQYGHPSSWDLQTLKDLGILPVFLHSTFYDNFDRRTKRDYRIYFRRNLRRRFGRDVRRAFKRTIRESLRRRSKRSTACIVGHVDPVIINDEAFPFDYFEVTQFNSCLTNQTVKDNLDAITGKVEEEEYMKVVLSKLREAYSSVLPEDQVQNLAAVSRVASVDDIDKWTITKVDTLASLMEATDGPWTPSLANAIVTKYLNADGNQLGTAELNSVGGVNLCLLIIDVLRNITQESLRDANALDVTSCNMEKKKVFFIIAQQAFASTTRSLAPVSADNYHLIRSYLGGADSPYIQRLANSNISMDLPTFVNLNEDVVLNTTVSEVRGLLGTSLPDLKFYTNHTLVQNWISRQLQSDLDTLRLGLMGGRANTTTNPPDPTTNPPGPTTNPPGPTTNPPGPTTNPPGPTTNPPDPTANPPGPTANPPGPTTNPPDPTANPPGPTTNPPDPTANPPDPTANPPGPTTNPPDPTANPPGPTTNPPGPTTNPPDPTANPPDPTANPPGPTTNPPGPTANPPDPTTNPPDPTANPPGPTTNPPDPTANPPGPTTNPPDPTANPPGPTANPPGPTANPPGPTTNPPGPTANPPGVTPLVTDPGTGSGSGATTTPSTTTGDGVRLRADAGLSVLLLLALLIASVTTS